MFVETGIPVTTEPVIIPLPKPKKDGMLEVMKRARDKIASGWLQGALRRRTEAGYSYCSVGAVQASTRSSLLSTSTVTYIDSHGKRIFGRSWPGLVTYNDRGRTTHEDVLQLFDAAIEQRELELM